MEEGNEGSRRKALEDFEGQDLAFVLGTGIYWETLEGWEERCHVVCVVRKADGFGKNGLNRNEGAQVR